MNSYIIDVKLPFKVNIWQGENFEHMGYLDPTSSDSQIWNYAKTNSKIIITQDCDFSNRILVTTPPPKIIHIQTGNLKLKELNDLIDHLWHDIEELISNYKLIKVFKDRIECIE